MSNLHLKENPTLGDIQKYVDDMVHERGFHGQSITQECMMLTEEIGELMKCVRKTGGMRMDAAKTYDIDPAGEVADILIVLASIANRLGVDMEQAFRDKEEKNKQRTWQ
jgi:NTP pyrophosphatase (non-canonical NTP hydrolase)